MRILVTGCAGFIGFHVAQRLLTEQHTVIGIDNLNPYYDPSLKKARLSQLMPYPQFQFLELDITHQPTIQALFKEHPIDIVVHLAAQAGVRYSIIHPETYIQSNLVGFSHLIEACRQHAVQHLIFASSSSVYGQNQRYPFTETDPTDAPISLYASTKKANELMAYSYAHLFHLPCTGLRFFTVYGPWGRPDMALFKFTQNILQGKPIDIYNHGKMWRDFTYIDDIVNGIMLVLKSPPLLDTQPNDEPPKNPYYRIYNMGSQRPISLLDFIHILEQCLKKTAIKHSLPMQPGDIPKTYADISKISQTLGYQTQTDISTGIQKFVDWYVSYTLHGPLGVTAN